MKTLNTIQKLSNTGKVLSRIVFIFCIIGFCGCIVWILSMALGVMFIVMSLGCRYGAELCEGKE